MDGVELLNKLASVGAKPENRKESEFVAELRNNGLVYFDREENVYKLYKEAVIDDGVDEVKVSMAPKIISLALFVLNDNFVPSLDVKPKDLSLQLNYLGSVPEINWNRVLKDQKLGNEFCVAVTGYGIDKDNEGYSVELPYELKELYCGKSVPTLTIGLSRFGKEGQTKNLTFKPIRRTSIKTVLGVKTTQGKFTNMAELQKAKVQCVFNKAEFYS